MGNPQKKAKTEYIPGTKPYTILEADNTNLAQNAADELALRGCVIIRGLCNKEALQTILNSVTEITKTPSISGSYGYTMKDCAKKFCDPFLLCQEVIEAVLDERILDCMKAYTGEEMIMAEANMKQDLGINDVYFPTHADFCVDGKWAGNEKYVTTKEIMDKPFAVGGIIYLTDTTSGAFCYSDGTHHWGAPHGSGVGTYPADMQKQIWENMIRVDGKAGDIVLFDDRGFHGPDQPSEAVRTVIIFDYTTASTFGKVVKAPAPILLPFLKNMNKRQLDALGWGCDINVHYPAYHTRSFHKHRYYKILSKLHNAFFTFDRMKITLRNRIKGPKPSITPKVFK